MKSEEPMLERIGPYSADVLDPFVLKRPLPAHQILKSVLLTIFLLPVRVCAMLPVLLFGWLVAIVGINALTEDERTNRKPLSGWRKNWMKPFIMALARLVFAIGGWHWIPTKGKRASPKEAPILLLVPHTSFWDTVPVIALKCPCMVVKEGTRDAPFFGSMMNHAQPVYVKRGDADSRQKTVDDILLRCRSGDDWDQVIICPEGTVTNGKALLEFKLGAFYPGVPIQPVFIRYPNRLDTITWAWNGPGLLQQIWLSLTQFHIYCELEFLPVYNPTPSERRDPRLYAENLRKSISKACNIPITYFSPDDYQYLNDAKSQKLPKTVALVKLLKLRKKTGLHSLDIKVEQSKLEQRLKNMKETTCDIEAFASYLTVEVCDTLKEFFYLIDQEQNGEIDVRIYNIGLWLLRADLSEWKRLEKSFKIFDPKGLVSSEEFAAIALLWRGLPLEVSSGIFYLFNSESKKKGTISFEIFKSVSTSFIQLEKNFRNLDKKICNNNINGTNENYLTKKSAGPREKAS